MFKILSVSLKTRLLIERNESLALSGFRVLSPRTPEEAPLLAMQQNVDAAVIGDSVDLVRRAQIIQAIRKLCPECLIVCAYIRPRGEDEPLAHAVVDVTDGPEALVNELRARLPLVHTGSSPLLQDFLRATIDASGADFGNIQVFDPATASLRIAAQHGFGPEFLRFFEVVQGRNCACGTVLACGARVVVPDVAGDIIFQGKASGEMMLRAQARAVQSTPLIGASGHLLGVASTHYRKRGGPSAAKLRAVDRLTGQYLPRLERQFGRLRREFPR